MSLRTASILASAMSSAIWNGSGSRRNSTSPCRTNWFSATSTAITRPSTSGLIATMSALT
jgi:hypothetical protein